MAHHLLAPSNITICKEQPRLSNTLVVPILHTAIFRPQVLLCADTPTGAEYVIYCPTSGSFTVDCSAMPSSRTLAVE